MQRPVLVIKLGSAVITDGSGKTDENVIAKLAQEISLLNATYRIVLVSSGAVGSGKAFIKNYKGTLTERKAAAAVGNPILIQLYHRYLSAYNITVAQALCERHHFSRRSQFLQLKETFFEFWSNNIIPVVNENDLVSNVELKFSDNDELATLIAIGFDAETLLICTSAGGFMDKSNNIIPLVDRVDQELMSYVRPDKSSLGLGGMLSKLTFTKLATSLGIRVVISGVQGNNPVSGALAGETGSTFKPRKSNLKARQKWLASGSITLGGIYLDKGAEKAVLARKSLLTVGISKTEGVFAAGEVVQLINEEQTIIGVAKVKISAEEIVRQIHQKKVIAVHANDIVTF